MIINTFLTLYLCHKFTLSIKESHKSLFSLWLEKNKIKNYVDIQQPSFVNTHSETLIWWMYSGRRQHRNSTSNKKSSFSLLALHFVLFESSFTFNTFCNFTSGALLQFPFLGFLHHVALGRGVHRRRTFPKLRRRVHRQRLSVNPLRFTALALGYRGLVVGGRGRRSSSQRLLQVLFDLAELQLQLHSLLLLLLQLSLHIWQTLLQRGNWGKDK